MLGEQRAECVRSTKAGTVVPATDATCFGLMHQITAALNEGRDRSPGDSTLIVRLPQVLVGRSTKAGTVVPATGAIFNRAFSQQAARSTKAGTVVPATEPLIAAEPSRWRLRSTKAGTVVPATVPLTPIDRVRRAARSTKAGTVVPATGGTAGYGRSPDSGAQRRPGP